MMRIHEISLSDIFPFAPVPKVLPRVKQASYRKLLHLPSKWIGNEKICQMQTKSCFPYLMTLPYDVLLSLHLLVISFYAAPVPLHLPGW
ncbi:MAG: hypothetical protein DSY91_06835 [Deltaproteobacteria bacterium]|nr:MAG: hypothetical protein DSY91_06835 [Deltaproteobacteria bacterium]